MARRKKRIHRRRRATHRAKRRTHRAVRRSGFGRSVAASSSKISFETIPKMLLAAAVLRFGSGLVDYWYRSAMKKEGADQKKLTDTRSKAKIIFPVLIAYLMHRFGLAQKFPGLMPMAVGLAFYSIVENTTTLSDLFDLKALDKKGFSGAPATEESARSWQQTRQQLMRMHTKSGLFLSSGNRTFNGITVRTRPLGFNGRDPRARRFSNT